MDVNLMKQKLSVKAKSGYYLNGKNPYQVPMYWILSQQVMNDIYKKQPKF